MIRTAWIGGSTASNAAPPPSNAPSAGTATVEDGTIAKLMLAAMKETP